MFGFVSYTESTSLLQIEYQTSREPQDIYCGELGLPPEGLMLVSACNTVKLGEREREPGNEAKICGALDPRKLITTCTFISAAKNSDFVLIIIRIFEHEN